MSASYFVKKIEVCPKCEGRGRIQHPAWAEYWNENKHNVEFMSKEDDRKWFESHGWYRGSCIDINTDGVPDEEIFCGECEGNGEIVSEVDLYEILPAFLESLSPAKQHPA